MRKNLYLPSIFALIVTLAVACGGSSVTKEQLANVKPGDVMVYRYQKDGKSWFYADKITRIDGDTIYYNASDKEGTSVGDERIKSFDTRREIPISKEKLATFETEQGDDRKVITAIQQ